MAVNRFEAKILEVRQETHDTKSFRLEIPKEIEFKFSSGQFVNLALVNDGESIGQRSFSISSSPNEKGYFEFTAKIAGRFTSRINMFKKGDKLKVLGPFGYFIFNDAIKDDLLLIAGGTGVAPFRSFIRYIVDNKLKNKVTLLYSCRTRNDIVYAKELKKLEKSIKVLITLTREEWDGLKGRIDKEFIKKNVDGLKKKLVYICGPPEMVESVKEGLISLNVDNNKIKTERWG